MAYSAGTARTALSGEPSSHRSFGLRPARADRREADCGHNSEERSGRSQGVSVVHHSMSLGRPFWLSPPPVASRPGRVGLVTGGTYHFRSVQAPLVEVRSMWESWRSLSKAWTEDG